MVPVPYTTRFIQAVVAYLEKAGHKPEHELEPKCDEYGTYLGPKLQDREDAKTAVSCKCAQCEPTAQQRKQRKAPTRDKINSVSASKREVRRKVMSKKGEAQRLGAPKVRKGWNQVHNLSREQLNNTPLSAQELANMSALNEELEFGRFGDGSLSTLESGIRHWYAFCDRARLPRMLVVDTPAAIRAATAQAEAFILYELSNFDIFAAVVNRKLWAVDQDHKAHRMPAPFSKNDLVKDMIKSAMASDEPAKSKVPLTERQMSALKGSLDLETREGFCLWTGLRFAIAFLCRVSEWAVNGSDLPG